ncbi:SGNH/GDSL hydrolase family protein [Streptomyces sp. MBT53]|uniref:SGNH/GDSL hydrolase family protein n=1 Tax=Streptomyces sp. MBT53 TaxID=1488384 RepID=UPI001913A6B1|nr:SGNH/GDSL hydrolase family protein [Streptomyces sp. MBT53]MBK6017618.1 SGNH/GDSL hydrolase family protein [Streptomyces sp. MBT53]
MRNESESGGTELVDPYCLKEGEADRLLAGHPWQRFVALGDSVVEGLGDPVPGYLDRPWVDRLAADLRRHGPDLVYRNLGRRNTRAALVRSTQLDKALAFGPDLALVSCGGYDTLVAAFDEERVAAELRAVVAALRESGSTVITVSMIDSSRSPQLPAGVRQRFASRLRALSDATTEIARDLGTLHIDLFDHPVGDADNLLSADGRHANRRGHAIAAAEAVRAIGAYLARPELRNGAA